MGNAKRIAYPKRKALLFDLPSVIIAKTAPNHFLGFVFCTEDFAGLPKRNAIFYVFGLDSGQFGTKSRYFGAFRLDHNCPFFRSFEAF